MQDRNQADKKSYGVSGAVIEIAAASFLLKVDDIILTFPPTGSHLELGRFGFFLHGFRLFRID